MDLMFDTYPVFEANQVLTSGHLNDVFDYLDQQTRLTRSNLIGIGIVCGLEIALDTSAGAVIRLTRGCGVTSEGYLVLEPEDVSLVAARPYTLPPDVDYPTFKAAPTSGTGSATQYPMWELFAAGEPNTTPLDADANFLDDKAMLLFLELKKQGLRNCSPNNCDDKGSQVTVTVRRLLIATADLEKIIAAANALGSGLTASDLDAALTAKLALPDLRVRRFDVPNTGPATANDVYAGLLNVFRGVKLALATGNALNAAYDAFKPLLQATYPVSPFGTFSAQFGFLDSAPTSTTQVRFLQYYVDLFEDLLRAYDEFRWKGVELLCACSPPDGLFPRHLMLGLLHPETASHPAAYRQPFLPSPAVGCCAAESKTVLTMFSRLAGMVAQFSNTPGLPAANDSARIDPQIRITPSVLGPEPLAARAIPYYYKEDGTPPLYRLWNDEKTRRNRANQNLSYRYDEYVPAAPAFVSDPLRYDLEPCNFLRVEGHLGKSYQHVLSTLLLLRSQYRLPVDFVAVRAGVYDDTQPVDLTKETARFQDLEALYDSLREELLSSLAAGAMDLYDIPIAGNTVPGGTPQLPLLKAYDPDYRYPAGSVGAFYEQHLQSLQAVPYIDIDQTLISDPAFASQVLKVYCFLFTGVTGLPSENFPHVVCIFYFSKLAEILPAQLDALGYDDFANKYQDLVALVRYFRTIAVTQVPTDLQSFAPRVELIDQFDQVLFECKLEPIKAVHVEYVRRIGELKKSQFLANFLQQHPGIRHKAGVSLGGTFVVVYHGVPPSPLGPGRASIVNTALFAEAFAKEAQLRITPSMSVLRESAAVSAAPASATTDISIAQMADAIRGTNVKALELTDAITRIGSDKVLAQNPDVNFLLGALTGRVPIVPGAGLTQGLDAVASKIIGAAVNELLDGTVIADFFLPYRIAGDIPGTQFVLPKMAPSFGMRVACTGTGGIATVTLDVKGGEGPYDVSVDQGAYQALADGTLSLQAGTHAVKIRDAAGTETDPQSITIPDPIVLGTPEFTCQLGMYTATFSLSGGTPPYTVNGKPVPAGTSTFTTDPVTSGATLAVEVVDSVDCSASASFTHTCPPPCDLPCDGVSLRRGYRMWLPDPAPNDPYKEFALADLVFSVESSPGKPVDLSAKVRAVIKAQPADLAVPVFPKLVNSWLAQINKIIASEPSLSEGGKVSWLMLSYEPIGPGRLGTLWIEYFQCLDFDIRVATRFALSSGAESLQLAYAPAATTMRVNDQAAQSPAFSGVRLDKCNPDTPPESLCPKTPQFVLKINTVSTDGTAVRLAVAADPASPDLQFLWEAQNANPPVGNGPTFATKFTQDAGTAGVVIVTAFTGAGCIVTQSARIPLGAAPIRVAAPDAAGPVGPATAGPRVARTRPKKSK